MKSKITIEIDFENQNSPFLKLSLHKSPDVRDKLLQSFIQSLNSKTIEVDYSYPTENIDNKELFEHYIVNLKLK